MIKRSFCPPMHMWFRRHSLGCVIFKDLIRTCAMKYVFLKTVCYLMRESPYSVQIGENTNQKKLFIHALSLTAIVINKKEGRNTEC